ncbi:asparagine synthetase A [Streptococcus pyogenes]|uniref:asparagine synthetase A n=1 Tax=Streptococcus pyogenes TaxID=1314 RepID=UPI002DD93D34|nr:asparagine synthetase A [Streptococcus pyogenes]WSE60728.1 asparagine synthetase A [Streptococcus pyogenes]
MTFFKNEGISTVHLPITTSSITSPMGLGSDSLPVKISLFDVDTYLADSMQFHLEYILRLFPKSGVHYLMPTFRGEAVDHRHLSQFYHSECEIEGDLHDVMNLVDRYIKFLVSEILRECRDSIFAITKDVSHLESFIDRKIPIITFEEACTILENEIDSLEYNDEHHFYVLTDVGEKKLMEHFEGVVWVKNYPCKSVPFYQRFSTDHLFAYNADLLLGIGETVGCGERCETYEEVVENMNYLQVDASEYSWYLEMKKTRPMKSSGFGLGVERLIAWILKCDDVRKVQLISRENRIDYLP